MAYTLLEAFFWSLRLLLPKKVFGHFFGFYFIFSSAQIKKMSMMTMRYHILFLAVWTFLVGMSVQQEPEERPVGPQNLATASDFWFGKGPAYKLKSGVSLLSDRVMNKPSLYGSKDVPFGLME